VLLVDDQRPFRRAAAAMLAQMEGYVVVGEAGSGEEGVDLASSLDSQLVVMDVRLPGINGVEATRRILDARPATVVILVSTYRAVDLPADMDGCGAVGFIPKEELGPEALAALCGWQAGPDGAA
jgi:DNA-binding NarL/FixJ family response regulator